MGNLICCYGENRNNKRGGTNVKTLLRKTERPGKRRRIDDLVRDALRREEREDRQKRKKEKKGNTRRSLVATQEPLEVQGNKKEAGTDEINSKEEHPEGFLCEESSNSADVVKGCNDETKDVDNEQADGCTRIQKVNSFTYTDLNTGSTAEPTPITEDARNEVMGTCQSTIEPANSTDRKENTNATECVQEKARTDQKDESKVTNDSETATDGIVQGHEEDTNVTNRCIHATVVDFTTETVCMTSARNDDDGDIQMTETAPRECIAEEDIDNRPKRESDSCLETTERVPSDEAVPSLEISCDSKLDDQQQEPDGSFCDEAGDIRTDNPECNEADALADIGDDEYSDLRVESSLDDCCKLNETHRESEEETLHNTYNEDHEADNTGFDKGDNKVDETETVDILKVHTITDNQPTYDGDITTTHNDDTVDILKVHGDDSLPESDEEVSFVHHDEDLLNIRDTYCMSGLEDVDTMISKDGTVDIVKTSDDDSLSGWDEGDTTARSNETVDVFKVHDEDGLLGYGDNKHRHNTEDEEYSLSTDVDSELEYDNTELTHNMDGDEECFSARGEDLELKSNLQSSIMSCRQCVTSVDLRKNLMNQSLMKYGVMNSMTNNGQKPQIREIERLKQDLYNFPPKLRQLTEQDRHGSIRDLKWSRHMRTKTSRDKWMKRFELEELMFLNDGDAPNNDVSNARDVSRASTPVPGTGSRFIKNNIVRPTTNVDKMAAWSPSLPKDF